MYLADWKDTLLVDKVQVPFRLEGFHSSRGYPLGYPDTRQIFGGKGAIRTRWRVSTSV
jgi:hypothetical protein